MKRLATSMSKRVFTGFIMSLVFLVTPTVLNYLIDQVSVSYYRYTDIEHFIKIDTFFAEYMCSDATEQMLTGDRFVRGVYPVEVSRELFQKYGNSYAKIYSEGSVMTVVEPTPDGFAQRIQKYDEPLPVGEYYWRVNINKVFLPNGVVRTDVPILKSNTFRVEDCEIITYAYAQW